MSRRSRAAIAAALVLALAVAATAANLFLLRLTQDSSDPVGRLSPRAAFPPPAAPSLPVTTIDEPHHGADD